MTDPTLSSRLTNWVHLEDMNKWSIPKDCEIIDRMLFLMLPMRDSPTYSSIIFLFLLFSSSSFLSLSPVFYF